LALLVTGLVAAALYWFPLRRWFTRWGTRPTDLTRVMTGDAAVRRPSYSATLAVRVAALPEDIWPWLVQIGNQRGGLYSYDWLDRLFGYLDHPSADRILPEHQHLSVGDVIPIGRGGGFPVTAIEAHRTLVLSGSSGGADWSWELALYPDADRRWTQLVSRSRVHLATSPAAWCLMRVLEPAAFLMTRRMLLGLKYRGELLARARGRRLERAA
jgi:hypothetical protein